jgi:chromate transporter
VVKIAGTKSVPTFRSAAISMQRGEETRPTQASLTDLAHLFLRLGTTAFGGPAAHIAIMEDEVVRRHRWLSREKFLDLLGATNLIPGPNSTEMAIHIGHQKRGWPGLLVAGFCFILPAVLIVGTLAWAYVRFGKLPQVTGILYGIKPVIIVVVIQALLRLGKTALKTKLLVAITTGVVVLSFLRIHELALLLAAGATGTLAQFAGKLRHTHQSLFSSITVGSILQSSATATAAPLGLLPIFLFFLKVGSVLFGSGYVLLAFLRSDLVERWHWLTNSQLLDAIAVGQVTPGPVFTTATFIGYVLAGTPGALVATIGIFLPAFVFVAISGPLVPKIRRSPAAGAFLDAVNAASLALMALVTYELGRNALMDLTTIALAVVSALLIFLLRVNSTWLILGGAVVGLLLVR